ncbi:MAG: insulinase family protein [Acidobacteria bacterium]|nr:insulinase family protein [Acidobacteriota bacterium]
MRNLSLLIASLAAFGQGAAPKPVPAKPGQLQVGAWKNLKFGKLADVKIPEVEVFTLKNGLKVYLLENHTLPFISGTALVRTGGLLDPGGKAGLSEIMTTVMRTGGSKDKTGDQIDEQLENIAAAVESGVQNEVATFSFNCLKENIDEVLGVYFDLLSQPEFRQDKIDLLKTQFRSAIARRYDDADEVNRNEFQTTVYGRDTPFGREVEYETLDAISRADLIDFYKRYYHPANMMFSVSGDFDKAAMRARLEQVLGNWTPPANPVPVFPKLTHQATPGIYSGDKPEVSQTFLTIGHLGGLYSDKDYPALEVLSDILAGGFDSRLFRKVRTELGYAYNIGGGWGADYLHPGTFQISASTKTESTVHTIQTILQEIEKIRASGVTDEEVATAKDKVINSFVFNFDRPQKTLSRLFRYDYYGYPKDYLVQYQKAIASVTKADVLRVAKQYIDPSKFVIVTIGNTAEFKTPLTDLKLPIAKLALKVKEPAADKAQVSGATLAKGKQILARMQQAAGGAENLANVRDVTMTANATLGNLAVKQKTLFISPNQLRQEQELPFGKVLVKWDGKTGTFQAPNAPGPMPMPSPVAKQITEEMFRNMFTLLLSDRNADRTVNAISDTAVEITDKSGNAATLTMDAATGLPAKLSYKMMGPQGPSDVESIYKDIRDIGGGVKAPFLVEINQGGKKASEIKYETITANTGVKPEEIMK